MAGIGVSGQQMWILGYLSGLEKGAWISPSKIGIDYGLNVAAFPAVRHHSAWASPKLSQLQKKGLVERSDKRNRRGWWRITDAGRLYFKQHKDDIR